MNRTWTWCLIALLSLASAAWSQDKMAGGTEGAVAALEQQWLQSQQTNNPDLVAPLLADKFVSTGSDGKVSDKAQSLAAFGNTAVATGDFKAKGTDASGKPLDTHERFTDTWVKMNGKWQCVASQASPVKM